MAIGDDFTIDYSNLMVSHSSGATVYSARSLYSYLQNTFDEQGQMDDTVPMSAQTPTAFTLINGWFIPEVSTRFIDGGSIQSSGWANVIYIAKGTETTAFEGGDIGLQISGATSGDIGTVLDFQTDNFNEFQVYIRASSSNDTFGSGELLQVTGSGGVGELTTTAASLTGEVIFTNIYTLGSVVSPTYNYILQSGSIIDGHTEGWWGEGFIDILLKTSEAGVSIDDTYLNIFAREYGSAYDNFRLQAGTGRNAVPMATAADGFNTTATESIFPFSNSITITMYTESQQIDLDNGFGAAPYKCIIDCGEVSLANVYEYTKWLTQRDTRIDIDDDVANFITGAIYQSVSESVHNLSIFTPNKQAPFGSYTGKFFAARSVFIQNTATADVKNFSLVDDDGTAQDPPNTVSVTATSVSGSDRVAIFRLTTAGGSINKTEYELLSGSNSDTGGANNQSGSFSVCVSGTIATDVPKISTIRIVEDSYPFSTWTNGGTGANASGTFFLTASVDRGTSGLTDYGLTIDYADTSASYIPIIDAISTTTTVSNTLVQIANIPVLVRVRNGTLDDGILPFELEQTITTNGLSVAAIRTADAINTSS